MSTLRWIAVAVGLALLACAAPDPDRLATFDGGLVERAELEDYLASLPAEARPAGAPTSEWQAEQLEELVLRRLLELLAERSGGEGARFRQRQAAYRRQATAMAYVRQQEPSGQGITEADLRARFEAHPERHLVPERREVFQVFRRTRAGEEPQESRRFVESVHARLQAGEPIAAIARDIGESQSRHADASLGWIERGQLPARLEEILFALPEGTPSEGVTTEEGVHVFLVGTVLPAQRATFEQARAGLLEELRRERQLALIEELIADALPPGSFVPTREEFLTLARQGDGRALALRVGEFEFRLEDLVERVEGDGQALDPESVWGVLEFIRQRELVYRVASAAGFVLPPAIEAQLDEIARNERVAYELERLLRDHVAASEGELRAFFEDRRLRYTRPLTLKVERLVIPMGPEAQRTMATLEARRDELDSGEWTLAAAAEQLGGTLREEIETTLSQLRAQVPLAARLVADLEPGGHSFPFRQGEEIMVLHLLDRVEPEPLEFEQARSRVVEDYLADHGERVVEEVRRDLFEQFEVELHTENLAPADGASVEP